VTTEDDDDGLKAFGLDGAERRAQGALVPRQLPFRQDLFDFLELCFAGTGPRPERIELRSELGPGTRKYGPQVVAITFKTDGRRPTKEQLFLLSQDLLEAARRDGVVLGRAQRYAVLAVTGGAIFASFVLLHAP
jgi:hypothetical protein